MTNFRVKKVCSKCKELRDVSDFGKSSNTKDGLRYDCKACRRKYSEEHRDEISRKGKLRRQNNRDLITSRRKEYYRLNKELVLDRCKDYYLKNKDMVNKRNNAYYEINKEHISMVVKKYALENNEKIIAGSKRKRCSPAKYDLHYDKLTVDESAILSSDGISLEARCRYCGKYFIPTNQQVKHREEALLGTTRGDNFLYCSNGCKKSCPTYRQVKYPKGFKKASPREVDSVLRKMCFERDNWECQICGKSLEEVALHCHHIEGYTQNPLLGNDLDNVITLCKEHHKEIHKLPGCRYSELKCTKEFV